jgi:hypothetical protein
VSGTPYRFIIKRSNGRDAQNAVLFAGRLLVEMAPKLRNMNLVGVQGCFRGDSNVDRELRGGKPFIIDFGPYAP